MIQPLLVSFFGIVEVEDLVVKNNFFDQQLEGKIQDVAANLVEVSELA